MNLKETLKSVKLHESTISMVMGAIIIIVVGAILINYFAGRRSGESIPAIETQEEANGIPSTHVVAEGEDLWQISEKYYGSGYNWVDIAQANDISDPNQIEVGQELKIPDVEPKLALSETTPTVTTEPESTEPEEKVVEPTNEPEDAEEVQESEKPASTDTHTVTEGESLWKIAENYYTNGFNWVDIAEENSLENPDIIEVGQELRIPDVKEEIASEASVTDPISGATYTVEQGDNLWKIAIRAYGDGYKWVEIASENDLDNPGVIHHGNVLSLPR